MGNDSSMKLASSDIEAEANSENDSLEGLVEENGSVDDIVLHI
jgi:hypothetical protein